MSLQASIKAAAKHPLFHALFSTILPIGCWMLFLNRNLRGFDTDPTLHSLLFASASLILIGIYVVRRPSVETTTTLSGWFSGLFGTAILSFLRVGPVWLLEEGIALMVVAGGIQIAGFLSLGGSFGVVASNRGVQTRGVYRIVRHPIYFSYIVLCAGFCIAFPTPWNIIISILGISVDIVRIFEEEKILKKDPAYQKYMDRVPYRLFPGVF